jgi:hypothetical protein
MTHWGSGEFDINADVVVVTGSSHQRVRPGDTGVILAKAERDTLVRIDRTQRRAWLPYQDLRCTRLGSYKELHDKERLVCPACRKVNHLSRTRTCGYCTPIRRLPAS